MENFQAFAKIQVTLNFESPAKNEDHPVLPISQEHLANLQQMFKAMVFGLEGQIQCQEQKTDH